MPNALCTTRRISLYRQDCLALLLPFKVQPPFPSARRMAIMVGFPGNRQNTCTALMLCVVWRPLVPKLKNQKVADQAFDTRTYPLAAPTPRMVHSAARAAPARITSRIDQDLHRAFLNLVPVCCLPPQVPTSQPSAPDHAPRLAALFQTGSAPFS